MASINGVNSENTNTSRVTGLASGMDVDELVEALTLTTQGKINKINQNIQTNEWKTEAYRDLLTKFTEFSDKYLSLTSKSSMRLSSSYSSYSVTAKGSAAQYLSVSTSSASGANAASNMVIGSVSSVASAAHYSTGSVTNSKIAASGVVAGTYETNNLKGQTIGFKINDGSTVTLTFKSDNIEDAVAELNEKLGDNGITAEYKDGTFSITATDENTLSFTGVSDKVKDIFGITTETTVKADSAYSAEVNESGVTSQNDVIKALAGQSITFNYNGISKKITLTEAALNEALGGKSADSLTDADVAQTVATALQKGLDNAFGAGRVVADVSENNELTFETSYATSTLSITSADSIAKEALGIQTGASNRVNLTGKAVSEIDFVNKLDEADSYTMTINDIELTFSKDDTVNSIMSKINSSGAGVTVSYSNTSNSFSFVANETGSQGRIDIKDVSGNLAKALFDIDENTKIEQGTDTIMSVSFDGGNSFNDVVRSTSSFSLDGVSLTLDKDIVGADFTDDISFVANNDTDKIYESIKTMIDDYNALIEDVNKAVKTRPDRDYAPLTDAQKEEMTEEQIEKWEEKAKVGILYGESEIRNLTYELSSAITGLVSEVGLPSSIGLTMSSDYNSGGKIEIDEEKLKSALTEDPDKVIKMLTNDSDSSTGVMERINDVVQKYAGTTLKSSYARSRGVLVNKAGIEGHLTENDNQLNDELKALKEELKKLETRLESEKERYYNKFSYLEAFINQQNSIASWVTAQLGY